MKRKSYLFIMGALLLVPMPSVRSQRTYLDNLIKPYRLLRNFGLNTIGRTGKAKTTLGMAGQFGRIQREVSNDVPFPCPLDGMRSPTPPESVHRLRPGDIDIIAALGDSLTAGNGIAASNILHVYTENRGLSWSIGGQGNWRQFFTLPNILKEYNPKLFGYSMADGLSIHRVSQFNCAEIAAMSRDMPYMAKELVKRMRNDPRVDMKNHWKMVTILIGANDFAIDMCYQPDIKSSPKKHMQDMVNTLRILRDNLPRTFVNIAVAPSFEILLNFKGVPRDCQFYHRLESPCFFSEVNIKHRPMLVNITKQWQEHDLKLEKMSEFNDRNDFAVIVQPFIKDVIFPKTSKGVTDFSYLSTDCYHFSQKGHARATNALWNNMMQPVGQKSTNWKKEFKELICPTTDSPYIYTTKNSFEGKNKTYMFDSFKNQHR